MTQLYVHPHIEDNFVEYNMRAILASPADGGAADQRRQLIEDYAAARVIVLRGVAVDYDRGFVNGLHFPHNWKFKKFPSRIIEAPTALADDPEKQAICQIMFDGDAGKYDYFESQLRAVNAAMRGATEEILRHHRPSRRDINWRHTETRVENLHFDVDKDAADFESVRLYLNMDDVPRIWHTTHDLFTLLHHYYDMLELSDAQALPLEELLHLVSTRLFGNWNSRGREQMAKHVVLFEPGDVWLVDGRTVPHQVIYGRRMAVTFYRIEPDGLPAWHPVLGKRIAEIHAAHGKTQGPVRSADDMKGYPFPLPPKGPKPAPGARPTTNLRDDWEKFYRDSIQQRLVRL